MYNRWPTSVLTRQHPKLKEQAEWRLGKIGGRGWPKREAIQFGSLRKDTSTEGNELQAVRSNR